MAVKIHVEASPKELRSEIDEKFSSIKRAATKSMHETVNDAKTRARANIASAGFSDKWQFALRGDVYPSRDISASPAGFIYHRIKYAGIYERGGTIKPRDSKYLWVPLRGTPKYLGRERTTPALWEQRRGDLQFIMSKGTPLLISKRRGRGRSSGSTLYDNRPLFVGLKSVTVDRRFSIVSTVIRATDQFPERFLTNLERE